MDKETQSEGAEMTGIERRKLWFKLYRETLTGFTPMFTDENGSPWYSGQQRASAKGIVSRKFRALGL